MGNSAHKDRPVSVIKSRNLPASVAKRVLVVEDDEGLNQLAQKTLNRAGFETKGVLTGREAIDWVNKDPDVVLLLDQQLPDMPGTELVHKLIEMGKPVPFVAVTGHGDENIAVDFMKLGARDYLVKGFDLTDLLPGVFKKVFRDLETDRKLALAEKELRWREERYKMLFNSGNDAVFVQPVIDGQPDKFSEVNDIACLRLGYSRKELLCMNYMDIVSDRTEKNLCGGLDQLVQNGECIFETDFISESGDSIPMELSCKYVESKESCYILTVARDITERVQAQAALKESEKKYRTMMEAMVDAAYICSADFIVEYMNAAMVKGLGRDATGETCYRAIHGSNDQCPWCNHAKTMKGESSTGEVQHPTTGKTYYLSNSPIHNSDGSISKLTIFRDISGIKKMEQQVQQVQRLQSIGTLAGGIAHDFNNILSPILGLAEMLQEDLPADSFEHESASEILRSALRAKDLVQQILSFSRQAENKRMPIRIQRVLKEAVKLMRSTIPSSIEIIYSDDQDCSPVFSDPTQIHQIVMNLITNAFHAVEAHGGNIKVQLNERAIGSKEKTGLNLEPGKYACLSVTDTGHGIDSGMLDQIFDPYFTTKAPGKGTGLGLSVVFGIVKDHGGAIQVDSSVGKGTTFDVYLPIRSNDGEEAKVSQTMSHHPKGTERILLVDDEEGVLRFVKQMLERLGYRIVEKTSSLEALEAFQEAPNAFDLVITDMTMPHMTGDLMAKEMLAVRPDVSVIICTGFSEQINKQKALADGIKGFLMKPVSNLDMAKEIRRVLDQRPVPSSEQ